MLVPAEALAAVRCGGRRAAGEAGLQCMQHDNLQARPIKPTSRASERRCGLLLHNSGASGGGGRSLQASAHPNYPHGGEEEGGHQAPGAGQPAGARGGAGGSAPREGQQPAPAAGGAEAGMHRGARWRAQALPCPVAAAAACRRRRGLAPSFAHSAAPPHHLPVGHASAAPPAHLLYRQL